MLEAVRNIFVRVVQRRMEEENKTAEEILNDYPKLSEQDKQEILVALQR